MTKQGVITVVSIDAISQLPIKNVEYLIIDYDTHELVEKLSTNENGSATSSLLDYGKTYVIRQHRVKPPYDYSKEVEQLLTIDNEIHHFIAEHSWLDYIKEVSRTADGELIIREVYIPVPTILQKPELPNGCEITSLTAVLNYYGYSVTKTEMSDDFLPKQPFVYRDGKLYGADPYLAYSGNPRNSYGTGSANYGGWFTYPPPVIEAAKKYIMSSEGVHSAVDISGSDPEDIIELLNQGIPVVTWMTLDLDEPRFLGYSWYLHDSEIIFNPPVNLHATVINGYVDDRLHVMDPLKGQVIYDANTFFNSYDALGSHAMIVVNQIHD
ncbi:MAG: C39 family peptidase [Bacillota bacterium]|nr:C39 family peptidase [Bacillota bacterium]